MTNGKMPWESIQSTELQVPAAKQKEFIDEKEKFVREY